MLVYGDRSEIADPRERLAQIADQLAQVQTMRGGIARHSKLVGTLIDAGQLLQGLADADFNSAGADRRSDAADALTAYACAIARAMCRSWDSNFAQTGELPAAPRERQWPRQVAMRTPEGFAYYAVYPELYLEAARRLRLSAPPRVIGIRSIGTSLGAVVAAALRAPPPITLRPHGDPFARQIAVSAELERELLAGEAHYVIVDEGPGESGSSFGAAADWLEARGVPLERIAFVPSHSGAPGGRASDTLRARWNVAQREPADIGDRLPHLLAQWSNEAIQLGDARLLDISAGRWRSLVYHDEQDWPAVDQAWERRKLLLRDQSDALLFKFTGLGAIGDRKLGMARALHAARLTPEPVALVHGFLIERWCEGHRLSPGEKPIAELGRYIATRARLFPARDDRGAPIAQLLEMCRRNISLAFGKSAAGALERWTSRIDAMSHRVVRVRTDNKLDRHEWLRTGCGHLIKNDALDHHAAHDLIGCQDMAWDIAGAIVEFDLEAREADTLIAMTESASGRQIDGELLEFCRLAYLAFRLGQASFASQGRRIGADETARLKLTANRYAAEVQCLLLESGSAATRPESLVG